MITNTPLKIVPPLLNPLWFNPRIAIVLTVGIAMLSGLFIARGMPHGPATAIQVLIVMAAGLGAGLFAGWAMRWRWGVLIVLIAHITAMELARLGMMGEPSVGAIRLDNVYGSLGLILGRGLYALVGLAPMAFGAALGAMLAQPALRPASPLAWAPMVLIGVALLTQAVFILRPAWPSSSSRRFTRS